MESLPEDVLLEIFSRLPARSAARLRAMSRSWRAELSSPSFVDLHLRRANTTAPPKLFCCPCDDKLMLADQWCLGKFPSLPFLSERTEYNDCQIKNEPLGT
ncbi:hypothetical protein OsI_34076 [Oryza sativa Indica Group]|uniref:F-box domain-containing protein n=1 Tax=Oryza sativa subsp. indica TaxID=39946 RepID=B8BHJ7_ORYSI|nr:hypothetical protein OsI_34076 [Oryza sativa Indica Group]